MIRVKILILIFIIPNLIFSQKFRIRNNDTIQYSESDHIYCNSFEILEGEIINRMTAQCQRIGYWIIPTKQGNIVKGNYNRWGQREGIWKEFDKREKLIGKTEYASVFDDTYILQEEKYKNGRMEIVTKKTDFVKFYLRHPYLIMGIILGSFFIRIPINIAIIENRNEKVYWFPFNTKSFTKAVYQTGKIMYPIWWNKEVSKNKDLRRISNILSIITYGGFFILLIGLIISGEI